MISGFRAGGAEGFRGETTHLWALVRESRASSGHALGPQATQGVSGSLAHARVGVRQPLNEQRRRPCSRRGWTKVAESLDSGTADTRVTVACARDDSLHRALSGRAKISEQPQAAEACRRPALGQKRVNWCPMFEQPPDGHCIWAVTAGACGIGAEQFHRLRQETRIQWDAAELLLKAYTLGLHSVNDVHMTSPKSCEKGAAFRHGVAALPRRRRQLPSRGCLCQQRGQLLKRIRRQCRQHVLRGRRRALNVDGWGTPEAQERLSRVDERGCRCIAWAAGRGREDTAVDDEGRWGATWKHHDTHCLSDGRRHSRRKTRQA
mmetsp:Transcript_32335/g.89349  ORF Transcript_32335/g.89349 Transcript_32335/m.89349 type:complete len:320 (+) Transcript_32335:307-1266(+)